MPTPSNSVLSERMKNIEQNLGDKIDSLKESAERVFKVVEKHEKKWVSQYWVNKIGLFLVAAALLANIPEVSSMILKIAKINMLG